MVEVWRDIKGFEGVYQVSNLGRVKSLDRYVECDDSIRHYKGRLMKPNKKKNGYLQVNLRRRETNKKYLVHRLVASAFLPNPDSLKTVNHKDENKENNCVDNLEWCTVEYNNHYGKGHRTRCTNARNGAIKNLAKPVLQYSLEGVFVAEYFSAMEAGRVNGIRQSGISGCCNGNQKTAYGYIWKYKDAK